jgi:hypothetical protein
VCQTEKQSAAQRTKQAKYTTNSVASFLPLYLRKRPIAR